MLYLVIPQYSSITKKKVEVLENLIHDKTSIPTVHHYQFYIQPVTTSKNQTAKMSKMIVFILLAAIIIDSEAVSVNQDLTLTKSQLETLKKFKANVLPKLDKDYQKTDIYLIRWLRARNFNVKTAEDMLISDLKWRRNERMDDINEEDWSDMQEEFPYFLDGYDKEGKPILTANFDEWDIRTSAVLTGKLPRLMRWMAKGMDDAVSRVRDLQAEGKNVTQWNFIINMNNFNAITHACINCLPIYTTFVSNYENHFPGSADKIIIINTPQVFEVVLNLIRPIMSKQTRDALKVYSNLKEEWEPILFNDINRDQLVKEYSGTKIRS